MSTNNNQTPRGPIEAIDLIHRSKFSSARKGILISVAKNMFRRKKECFASARTLGQDAGLSERQARRQIAYLCNGAGVLEVDKRPGKPSIRTINWATLRGCQIDLGQTDTCQGDIAPLTPCHGTHDTMTPEGSTEGSSSKGSSLIEKSPSLLAGERLAFLLLERILQNNPTAKLSDESRAKRAIEKWSKEFDLMIRKDKRPEPEIRELIQWCQNDSFWRANILSAKKLRDKRDQLVLKMEAAKTQISKGGSRAAERTQRNLANAKRV